MPAKWKHPRQFTLSGEQCRPPDDDVRGSRAAYEEQLLRALLAHFTQTPNATIDARWPMADPPGQAADGVRYCAACRRWCRAGQFSASQSQESPRYSLCKKHSCGAGFADKLRLFSAHLFAAGTEPPNAACVSLVRGWRDRSLPRPSYATLVSIAHACARPAAAEAAAVTEHVEMMWYPADGEAWLTSAPHTVRRPLLEPEAVDEADTLLRIAKTLIAKVEMCTTKDLYLATFDCAEWKRDLRSASSLADVSATLVNLLDHLKPTKRHIFYDATNTPVRCRPAAPRPATRPPATRAGGARARAGTRADPEDQGSGGATGRPAGRRRR
jgi:hypothetical protein